MPQTVVKFPATAGALEDKLRPVLRNLNSVSAGIESSAVVTGDGLNLASELGNNVDPDRFSAMCASLLALADRTAREISRGELKQVLIEGDEGCMLAVHVGNNAVLAVATRSTINLGMVFLEARKTAAAIAELIAAG